MKLWTRAVHVLFSSTALLLTLTIAAIAADPSDTWESYSEAGNKAYQQGDYTEAERQLSAALKIAEGFGPQDRRLVTTLDNLADVYQAQGRYAEAEQLLKRSLTIRQSTLGPGHPDVSKSLDKLASLYRAQGKDSQAERFTELATLIRKGEFTLGQMPLGIGGGNVSSAKQTGQPALSTPVTPAAPLAPSPAPRPPESQVAPSKPAVTPAPFPAPRRPEKARSGDTARHAPDATKVARSPVGIPASATPSAADAIAATDKYLQELARANIAYSAPAAMDEDATADVVLWLDPTGKLPPLLEALRATVGPAVRVEGAERIQFAPRTRATLSSPGFDIAPQSTIEQAVSATQRTEWTWQIHPKDTGKQTLHLTLEAMVPTGDKESYRELKTFEQDIAVHVSARSFVKHNWQWLLGTLVVPVTVWVWKQRKRHKAIPSVRIGPK